MVTNGYTKIKSLRVSQKEMNRLNVKEHLDLCPFCNAKADCYTDYSPAGYKLKYVACVNCGCRTKDFSLKTENIVLINTWNRRAGKE